jgi:hypothetical protein
MGQQTYRTDLGFIRLVISPAHIDGLTLTIGNGPVYTHDSRWARRTGLRASCHSTHCASGLPSGISESSINFTGSFRPFFAAARTYEQH